MKLTESQLINLIKESVNIILSEQDEKADNMGNGTPGFFQKLFNTKANRAYNFRKDLGGNSDYGEHVNSMAKLAMKKGKEGADLYGNDYIDDNGAFNSLRGSGKYKGVNTHKIAKDVYGQKFQSAFGIEKGAESARRRAESERQRAQFADASDEIKKELQYEFTKSPINWKRITDLQGSLASKIGRDSALEFVNDLKTNNRYVRESTDSRVRFTSSQFNDFITESVKRILNEIGYHEKQKREVSDEEHEEWIRKKSAAKKKYYDSQKKDDESGSKAIDYYKYKHGDHPEMSK